MRLQREFEVNLAGAALALELLEEIPPFFLTYPIMRRYGEIRRTLRHIRAGPLEVAIAVVVRGERVVIA